MKSLITSIKYNLLMYYRIKVALFFTFIFPTLLFVIFGSIWGISDPEYIYFLLSGVVAMNVVSQGIYSTGAVIKQYYQDNIIKFLKGLPMNVFNYFLGMVICRALVVIASILMLTLIAFLFFGYTVTLTQLILLVSGSILGLILFSFMGLIISFSGNFRNTEDAGKEIGNIVYFLMIFLCDCFYPVSELNSFIATLNKFFPLTYLLNFYREENIGYALLMMFAFFAVFALLFMYLFKRKALHRV